MKHYKKSQYYRKSPREAVPDEFAGSQHTVTIEKVVPGGMGLCRINGQVIFVPGSLPGEEIRIELGSAKGGFRPARILEIIQVSPKRLPPPCPHYGGCGGCDFQYAQAEYQLELKQAILADTLRRQGGLDVLAEGLAIAAFAQAAWSYRNRMQFHPAASVEVGMAKLGLMARDSTRVIPLSDCPVAAGEIRSWLKTKPDFVASPQLSESEETGDAISPEPFSQRMKVFGSAGQLSIGNLPVNLEVAGRRLEFSTGGFFQSNVAMLHTLLQWLTEQLPTGVQAWDLYSGCGVFAAALEKRFDKVSAVDNQAVNVDFARRNTDPKRTTVFHANVDDWLSLPDLPLPDFVMVDPPRAGLSRHLTQWLCNAHPQHIGYVSCNPVTFSRDLKLLRAAGYHVAKLALFDFYPQTWHLETACLFEREKAR